MGRDRNAAVNHHWYGEGNPGTASLWAQRWRRGPDYDRSRVLHYGLVVDILTGSQAGEDVKYRMPCLAVLHACRCIRRLPCKRAPPSVIRGACVVGASRVVGPYRPAEAGYAQGRRNGIASCCSLFGIHPANPTFWVRGLDQIDSSIHGLDI